MLTQTHETLPSSFRDPSGFLFRKEGILYRQINRSYKDEYDALMSSGLYGALTNERQLVRHAETDWQPKDDPDAYRIIRPDLIPFVSYPYEWSFSQLRDAALLTVCVQKKAFTFGMSLKDASAYNVQFTADGRPIFIDTLSFERYRAGNPYAAYGQFCRHFLAPLALMKYKDARLGQLLRIHQDGIPLDLASALLPARSHVSFSLLCHIHLHARSQAHYAHKPSAAVRARVSRRSFEGLIDSLESAVRGLTMRDSRTPWGDYYSFTNYSAASFAAKKALVKEFLDEIMPREVWDLGANNGLFSKVASQKGIRTVAFDNDPVAVDRGYRASVKNGEKNLLFLLLDICHPSSGAGFANRERASLLERGPADAAMALALVHHLAISNNVPFRLIASFFASLCRSLIIEFIPKNDSQVQELLAGRKDVFPDYARENFEEAFHDYFEIKRSRNIPGSRRTLYLMCKREHVSMGAKI